MHSFATWVLRILMLSGGFLFLKPDTWSMQNISTYAHNKCFNKEDIVKDKRLGRYAFVSFAEERPDSPYSYDHRESPYNIFLCNEFFPEEKAKKASSSVE